MNTFGRHHLYHIKDIFQEKTGVELIHRRRRRLPMAAGLAAVIACGLTATAFAVSLFSSLSGDDLSLGATYEGDGIVSIHVENRSEKDLTFQPVLQLVQWNTGEEVKPCSDSISFSGRSIPAGSSGTMTIDLSDAYDMTLLEQPLTGDWYYLRLTNNGFVFGQDWMCSVDFAPPASPEPPPESPAPVQPDAAALVHIEDTLRFYFETVPLDAEARRALNDQYAQAYTKLFADFEGTVIPSVSPILPGNRISPDVPRLTAALPAPGEGWKGCHEPAASHLSMESQWHSCDAAFKLLGAEGEYGLVLSALLPMERYQDTFQALPLFYLLTYEKSAIDGENTFAFLRGQLIPFSELASCQVYEDDRYVCYEVSRFVYSDLEAYVRQFAAQNPGMLFDDRTMAQVEHLYRCCKENLEELLHYEDPSQTSSKD